MKQLINRRILALLLVLGILLPMLPVPARAEEQGSSTGSRNATTLPVREETICVPLTSAPEREVSLNKGWKFFLGTQEDGQSVDLNDGSWQQVDLPHDFSIGQSFTTVSEAEVGFLPGGTGWYRRDLVLSPEQEGRRFVLNFDGSYRDTYVYVNGQYVGENHYGYNNFAFDITDSLSFDGQTPNLIAVKVVNELPTSRWYSGSGLYRDVSLIVTAPVHVARFGTTVTTPDIASGLGTVNADVCVQNESSDSVNATVRVSVCKKGESTVLANAEETLTIAAGEKSTTALNTTVSSPALWSTEDPNLYVLRTEIEVDGSVVDTYDTEFGFRWFVFDATAGFSLNGTPLKLNGVCVHHDQGALGAASYYDAMYRQMEIMKDMGCNAIRTSHNPADEDLIAICNELGLLVVEELFDGWSIVKNYNTNDFSQYFAQNIPGTNGILGGGSGSTTWAQLVAESVIGRDKNAPCIIMWSVGNELSTVNHEEAATVQRILTEDWPVYAANLVTWITAADGTRPITIGNNKGSLYDSDGTLSHGSELEWHTMTALMQAAQATCSGGVMGFNYPRTNTKNLIQNYTTAGIPVYSSESASAVNSRGVYTGTMDDIYYDSNYVGLKYQENYSGADGKLHLSSYDISAVPWGTTAHDTMMTVFPYDAMAGQFVWTGFDYIGEPTPWNGDQAGNVSPSHNATPNSSYFGIVDTAGFEKDSYYLYRSQWNRKETTLHLVTSWDSNNYILYEDGTTPVWVYSNAPVVKLYLNDTHIATATRMDQLSDGKKHTYYFYDSISAAPEQCTVVPADGADKLYAAFRVSYAEGTLSAKAFEADGTTEIPLSGNSGKNSVTTPGAAAQLVVSSNQTAIPADGSSLAYIMVDVVDANGNPITTAENMITFSLTGNGEIIGVDNGDQATTEKFQQSMVLESATSARIKAWAGKALVIVRSTKESGAFTLNVNSEGLTAATRSTSGAVIEVDTLPVEGVSNPVPTVESYTLTTEYVSLMGFEPALLTTATGTMTDGSAVEGVIAWDAVPNTSYSTAGTYSVQGQLSFAGCDPISVIASLRVADPAAVEAPCVENTELGEALAQLYSAIREAIEYLYDSNTQYKEAIYAGFSADVLSSVLLYEAYNQEQSDQELPSEETRISLLQSYAKLLRAYFDTLTGTYEELLENLDAPEAVNRYFDLTAANTEDGAALVLPDGVYYLITKFEDTYYVYDPITPEVDGFGAATKVQIKDNAVYGARPEMALTFTHDRDNLYQASFDPYIGNDSGTYYLYAALKGLTYAHFQNTTTLLITRNPEAAQLQAYYRGEGRFSLECSDLPSAGDQYRIGYDTVKARYAWLTAAIPEPEEPTESTSEETETTTEATEATYHYLYALLADRIDTEGLYAMLQQTIPYLEKDSRDDSQIHAKLLTAIEEAVALYNRYNGVSLPAARLAEKDALEDEVALQILKLRDLMAALNINRSTEAGMEIRYFGADMYNWDENKMNELTKALPDSKTKGFYFTAGQYADATLLYNDWKWQPEWNENLDQFNTRVNAQQYGIYSGLATTVLDASNNPFVDSVVAADFWGTESIVDEDGSLTKAVYNDVGMPFLYDPTTGYYSFSSDENAVYFQGQPQSDTNLAILDKPSLMYVIGSLYNACEPGFSRENLDTYRNNTGYLTSFQPFCTTGRELWTGYRSDVPLTRDETSVAVPGYLLEGSTLRANASMAVDPYHRGTMNWGFGMQLGINFKMPTGGMVNVQGQGNEPIIFEFSGDDDVWVYVDGKLVLDIGGTHDAIQGQVNFATGEVTVYSDKYERIRDMNMTGYGTAADTQENLDKYTLSELESNSQMGHGSIIATQGYDKAVLFQKNLYGEDGVFGTNRESFASGREIHELKVYYMDRGKGTCNCAMRFNLPQTDSLTVKKEISDTYSGSDRLVSSEVMEQLNEQDFSFILERNGSPVPNEPYDVFADAAQLYVGNTDRNGVFTLKNGQSAVFSGISLSSADGYRIVEQNPGGKWGNCAWDYELTNVSADKVEASAGIRYSPTVYANGNGELVEAMSFTCTNAYLYGLAEEQTVVMDYGKPIDIAVIENGVYNGVSELVADEGTIQSFTVAEDSASCGTATLSGDRKSLRYTLNGFLEQPVKLLCIVDLPGEDVSLKNIQVPVTILPATLMYYEAEDFAHKEGAPIDTVITTDGGATTAKWEVTGDNIPMDIDPDNLPEGAFYADFDLEGYKERYKDQPQYCNNDFDQGVSWHSPKVKTNDLNTHIVNNSTGTLELSGLKNNTSAWVQTVICNSPLGSESMALEPGAGHYAQLRFHMENCEPGDAEEGHVSIYFSNEAHEEQEGNIALDERRAFVTLSAKEMCSGKNIYAAIPLDGTYYSNSATKIDTMRLCFDGMTDAGSGKIVVDYLYVGPYIHTEQDLNSTVDTVYDMIIDRETIPDNSIFIDFDGDGYNDRYKDNPVYGGMDFDNANSWYYDKKATTGFVVNTDAGIMQFSDLDTTNNENHYNYVLVNGHNLQYLVGEKDYCQVRLRVDGENAKSTREDGTTSIALMFAGTDKVDTTGSSAGYVYFPLADHLNKGYFTLTFPLGNNNEHYKAGNIVDQIAVQFGSVQGATFTIDYIFVGPTAGSKPVADSLFFGFDDMDADRERYDTDTYGYTNFDVDGSWSVTVERDASAVIMPTTGVAIIDPDGLDTSGSGFGSDMSYMHTGAVIQDNPLDYHPGEADVAQFRFRIEGTRTTTADPQAILWYGVDSFNPDGGNFPSAGSGIASAEKLDKGEYVTVTFALNEDFRNANTVSNIKVSFAGVKGATAIIVDYVYVGPGEMAPTVYGYDSSYTNDTELSNGSSLFVEGQGVKVPNATTNPSYSEAYFSFTGTGFDLISRTGKEQATIRVTVYSDDSMSKDSIVKTLTVNNKGELELYQIPVVSVQGLDYGTYHVTVGVNKAVNSIYDFLSRGGDFYFDGIRIYDPIDVRGTNLTPEEQTALEVYKIHKEAYAHIKEVRNILLSADDFSALVGSTEGAVFIDVNSSRVQPDGTIEDVTYPDNIDDDDYFTADIQTYNKVGPKNEVYLAPSQAVAFKLQIDSTRIPESLDVGVKIIDGSSAKLAAGIVGAGSAASDVLSLADVVTGTIEAATAQYYPLALSENDIIEEADGTRYVYVVILNNSAENDKSVTDQVLSVTDVKVAYATEPDAPLPEDSITDPEIKPQPTEPGSGEGTGDTESSDDPKGKRNTGAASAPVRFMVDGRTAEAVEAFLKALNETPLDDTPTMVDGITIYHSLNLASDISINYAVPKTQLEGYENISMKCLLPIYEGNVLVGTREMVLEPVENGHYYYFTLTGLTAVNVGDAVEASLHMTKEGKTCFTATDTYSVAQYAYSQMGKDTVADSLKTLCAELLRYGSKAQIFKGYRTDSLADAAMTETHRAYLSDMEAVTFGNTNKVLNDLEDAPITWVGKVLNLQSKVALKFVFNTAGYSGNLDDLNLRVSYTDIEGKTVTATVKELESYNAAGGLYAFSFDGLLAAELRSVVSVQIYAGNVPVSCTLQYSADTYGNNKTGTLLDLCKALFAYSDSAKVYFQ